MVSIMDETLKLTVGQTVLEVGTGSGWHASTIAEIVAPLDVAKNEWGHVYTVEIIPELAEFAKENIKRAGFHDRITVVCGDGSTGYPEKAPYDRILVTAAAPRIPQPLIEQLKPKGVMVLPVGGAYQYQTLIRVQKSNGDITEEQLGGVAFVPLTGKHGHRA